MSQFLESPRQALLILILLALFSDISFAAGPPAVLRRTGSNYPFFVSAAAATNADGSLNSAVLGSDVIVALESRQQQALVTGKVRSSPSRSTDAPCPMTMSYTHEVERPFTSWKLQLENADAVIMGKVVSVTPGFRLASPVLLVAVEVMRFVRTSKGYPLDVVYIVWPAADFLVGTERYCNSGPIGSVGFAPKIGDQAMLFAYSPPEDESGRFLPTEIQNLFFAHAGRVNLPPSLRRDPTLPTPVTMDGLARSVVAHDLRRLLSQRRAR